MKYYQASYVIDALKQADFPKISAKECLDRHSEYNEYALFANRIYSKDEIESLPQEEKSIILNKGRCVTEDWLISAVKGYILHNLEIIENNINLEQEQKLILKILLECDLFYVPLHFMNINGMYSVDKIDIAWILLNSKWKFDCFHAESYENIYILSITFNDKLKIGDFLGEYISKNDTFNELELYIPYRIFLSIYRKVYKSPQDDFWELALNKEDFENNIVSNEIIVD